MLLNIYCRVIIIRQVISEHIIWDWKMHSDKIEIVHLYNSANHEDIHCCLVYHEDNHSHLGVSRGQLWAMATSRPLPLANIKMALPFDVSWRQPLPMAISNSLPLANIKMTMAIIAITNLQMQNKVNILSSHKTIVCLWTTCWFKII